MLKFLKRAFRKAKPGPDDPHAKGGTDEEPKADLEPPPKLLGSSLPQTVAKLREEFGEGTSFMVRTFRAGPQDQYYAAIAFIDGLVDRTTINDHILRATMFEAGTDDAAAGERTPLLSRVLERYVTAGETKLIREWAEAVESLEAGGTVLLFDGSPGGIAVATPGWERRGVEEPVSESVVRGPRDGFTETIRTNETLIRRRIKSSRLRFERHNVGELTKTEVNIAYINGLASDGLVQEVRERLTRIKIDGILESGYIEEYIQDSPWSPFPQVLRTERPDIVAANLLEGRVAIFTDNTPFVLVVPVVFSQLLSSPEDYYERFPSGSLIRLLRYVSFAISLILPAVYIAIITFHQELLPTDLILAVAAARQGVPFPALVEAILMEVLFEILREAGIRLPRVIGTAVSIVGALVIGEAAVNAGLVSPAMVIVVALTAIASFATPTFSFAITGRILRFAFMLSAAALGLFGIQLLALLVLLHLVSLRSFGVPYMAPFAPVKIGGLKDTFMRVPIWAMIKRPPALHVQDETRQPKQYRMRPPAEEMEQNAQGHERSQGGGSSH